MTNDSFITIDEDRLDQEVIRQPQLVVQAGNDQAEARYEYAKMEARLDLVEADLYLKIRRDPETYGFTGKPTVDEIKAAVKAHKDHRIAVRNVAQAKHTLDIMSVRVNALEHKRKSLEELVQLNSIGYRSTEIRFRGNEETRERVNEAKKDKARKQSEEAKGLERRNQKEHRSMK